MTDSLSPATRAYIQAHRRDDVRRLALSPGAATGVDVPAALQQIEGWQRLRLKVPALAAVPDLLYPPAQALEQCSSQEAAEYKATLVGAARGAMADLTGGLGVDFLFMAPLFARAAYVEQQAELCAIARHNFARLGLGHARVVQGDGLALLPNLGPLDLIYIDPSRRTDAGRRVALIEDCRPNVALCAPTLLARAPRVLVKLSPMLDVQAVLRALPRVEALHVVGVEGEVKELLAVLSREAEGEAQIRAVNLRAGAGVDEDFSFTLSQEQAAPPPPAAEPQAFLYVPSAPLMKSGAFKLLAARYGLSGFHGNSRLYTAATRIDGFPGRRFAIDAVCGFGKRELRRALAGLERANVAVRNFPEPAERLRRRLGLTDGGSDFLFATTLASGRHVLIRCHKD